MTNKARDISRRLIIPMMRSVIAGTTFREAGEAAGLSPSWAQLRLRLSLRESLSPENYQGELPDYDISNIKNIRANSNFWLNRVDVLAKKWGIES